MFLLNIPTVLAMNLEFTINVPDKIFFPNETIPLNISITNRETSFTARNVTMEIYIGKRSFLFELGNIKASKFISKNLTLPEFSPGDYVIKGQLNYTGFFDEKETLETYNSFHVRFPEMERLPRNINIKEFSIPSNITAGKEYRVLVKISNNGNVGSNLIVVVTSPDVTKSKRIYLEPGESEAVVLDVVFYNPGISAVEARVYAVVNDVKYLLSFDTASIFVKEFKVAKLLLKNIEFVDETDNKINQNDVVKLRISLLNNGTWLASDVKGILTSSINEINVVRKEVDFGVIPKNDYSSGIFEIKTNNVKAGEYKLRLNIAYSDNFGEHSSFFEVPISVSEGGEGCSSDNDCSEDQICSNGECIPIVCECGKIVNHQCIEYECCSNLDCEEGYTCNPEKHICEPFQQISADVLIVTSSKLKTNDEYKKVLKEYRKTILDVDELTSFYILVDSPKVKEIFNVEPADPDDWRSVKRVLDKIIYKIQPQYLLIIGGVNIIPQPPAKTDAEIPTVPTSDDRYADIDLDGVPDVALGRIPTPSDNSVLPVIKVLTSAIKVHKKFQNKYSVSKVIFADMCGTPPTCYGLDDVNYISEILFGKNCSQFDNCKPIPPYCDDILHPFVCSKKDEVYDLMVTANFIYINAHGEPYSFAAHTSDGKWYTLITSSSLYDYDLIGNPIVSTVACHSGTIDCEEFGCINEKGSVFAFLANGASIYIGNTRYGYFGVSAKLLGNLFEKVKDGYSFGEALLKVKQKELKEIWSEWYKAVIYEIQLYGDPTIKLMGVGS